MELSILPITKQNRQQALALRVAKGQESYVESVAQCLSDAEQDPDHWRPVGLYHKGIMVGFAMYGLFPWEGTGGRVWLDRLLIDGAHQGQGLGSRALEQLIEHIYEEYHFPQLFLSVVSSEVPAVRLYQRVGFDYNKEKDPNGELVMVLNHPPLKREQ